MKSRLFVCLLTILFSPFSVLAQKEATHWFFGPKLGFDFSDGVANVVHTSAMTTARGCASISDKTSGELLFYSNGRNTWNRFHQRMPASNVFPEDCSNAIVQSVLIVPMPGNADQYYLFSLYAVISDETDSLFNCMDGDLGELNIDPSNYFQLYYSIIDMRLDNGKGDLVPGKQNVFLQTNLTTKLTAIPHTNGTDYWLVVHEWRSNSFYTYLLNESDISPPSPQAIGSVHEPYSVNKTLYTSEILGEIKASPDGRKLASAVYNITERSFDVFDFDASTGTISNYQNFGDISQQMGVTFSPDNSKLYVTSSNKTDKTNFWELIRQYNLLLPTTEAIKASGKSIIRYNPKTNIQEKKDYPVNVVLNTLHLAPDGKIYGAGEGSINENGGNNDILVIAKPNLAGFECVVSMQRFPFGLPDSLFRFRSFPNFIQSYFNQIPSTAKDCSPENLVVYPNPTSSSVMLRTECTFIPIYADIIDHLGRIVDTQCLTTTVVRLDQFAKGMYILRLRDADQKQVIKKVVKI